MKRLLALILTAILCLCCLASCGGSYNKNEFFSEEMLTQNKLADMPVPPHVDNSVNQYGNILYLNLTKDEYESYVSDLLQYLRAKEDISYLGYSVGSGLVAEMIPYDEIAPITDSYSPSRDSHKIFFSTKNGIDDNNYLNYPVEIEIIRKSGKLNFDNFEYNTQICISDGYSAQAQWNLCGTEHTYDEGIEYKIAGSDRTITEYTCVNCGSTELSDFIGDMKFYNITIEDIDNCLIDHPTEGISGTIYRVKAHKIIDADLKFVVNGTRIYPRETDDDKWIYEFVMPCEDIVITAEIVGDSPAPTNHFLRNQAGCEWLNELSVCDIAEIKIISEAVGVTPGNLKNISSSTDEAVIARIFEEYYCLDTRPIFKTDGQIGGGSCVTVKFILKDGTAKELYINNGNYLDTNGDYFKLLYTPGFKDTDSATNAYGFTDGSFPYPVTGTVYDKDNDPVCEIPMDEFEFVVFDGDLPAVITGYFYTVKTAFGTLRFNYRSDLFYVDLYGEECNIDCYQLIGKNLDELIAQYSTNSEPHSISYQSDRTAELLMEGFAPTSAKPGDTVVLRTYPLMDADLTFYANGIKLTQTHADSDYWEYVFTMPDEDVVITHEITDGFLPN